MEAQLTTTRVVITGLLTAWSKAKRQKHEAGMFIAEDD